MGFRSRLKGKIKETLQGVGALAKVIHDEANHPGRPQPHMAARNPLWGGGDPNQQEDPPVSTEVDSTAQTSMETASVKEVTVKGSETEAPEEVDYWFLNDEDGEGDDWSKTNPKD